MSINGDEDSAAALGLLYDYYKVWKAWHYRQNNNEVIFAHALCLCLLWLCQVPKDRRRVSSGVKPMSPSAIGPDTCGSLAMLDHHLQALRSTPVNLSLNNSTPQRPRSCYDSLSKFDFSSHLHSINSPICLILYLNCSSGRQERACLGKGRRTVLEKLHWWVTGEIDRDVSEQEGEKTPNQQNSREKLHSSILYYFFILLSFLLWHRGSCRLREWNVSCVIVAFTLSEYHQI